MRARLKRLEDSGLIKIHAQVDPNATNGAPGAGLRGACAPRTRRSSAIIDDMVDRPEFWTVDRTVGEYNVLALAHAGSREQLADIVDELRSATGHRAQRDVGAVGTAALGVPLGSLLSPANVGHREHPGSNDLSTGATWTPPDDDGETPTSVSLIEEVPVRSTSAHWRCWS